MEYALVSVAGLIAPRKVSLDTGRLPFLHYASGDAFEGTKWFRELSFDGAACLRRRGPTWSLYAGPFESSIPKPMFTDIPVSLSIRKDRAHV